MATLARSLHRMRAHHPERTLMVAGATMSVVYLSLHQDLLTQLNLLFGP